MLLSYFHQHQNASDIGVRAREEIIEDLKEKVKENKIKQPEECKHLLIETIKEKMNLGENAYDFENKQSIVMLIGVNGVGKTTSVGKLAGLLKAKNKKVIMAAADTFRAAAIEQLTEWSKRTGTDIIAQSEGSDPAAAVRTAVSMFSGDGSNRTTPCSICFPPVGISVPG